jgi:uncharacterized membrane protein YjjB (DUF3815 family)
VDVSAACKFAADDAGDATSTRMVAILLERIMTAITVTNALPAIISCVPGIESYSDV